MLVHQRVPHTFHRRTVFCSCFQAHFSGVQRNEVLGRSCQGAVPGPHADQELISFLVGRLAIDRFTHLPSTTALRPK